MAREPEPVRRILKDETPKVDFSKMETFYRNGKKITTVEDPETGLEYSIVEDITESDYAQMNDNSTDEIIEEDVKTT